MELCWNGVGTNSAAENRHSVILDIFYSYETKLFLFKNKFVSNDPKMSNLARNSKKKIARNGGFRR